MEYEWKTVFRIYTFWSAVMEILSLWCVSVCLCLLFEMWCWPLVLDRALNYCAAERKKLRDDCWEFMQQVFAIEAFSYTLICDKWND